jgi:hypothetical protein
MILMIKSVPRTDLNVDLFRGRPLFEQRVVQQGDLPTPSQIRDLLTHMVGSVEGLNYGGAMAIINTKLTDQHRAMVRDERELYQLQAIEGMAAQEIDYGGVQMNMLEHFVRGFSGVRREDWGSWAVTGAHWLGNAVDYHLRKNNFTKIPPKQKLKEEVRFACRSGNTLISYKHAAFFKMNAEMGMVINYHSPEEIATLSASRQLDSSFVAAFSESKPVDPADYAKGLVVVRKLPVHVYLGLSNLDAPDFLHHQEFSKRCLIASGDHLKTMVGSRVKVELPQEDLKSKTDAHKMFQLTHGFGGSHRVLYHLLCAAEGYTLGSHSTR